MEFLLLIKKLVESLVLGNTHSNFLEHNFGTFYVIFDLVKCQNKQNYPFFSHLWLGFSIVVLVFLYVFHEIRACVPKY